MYFVVVEVEREAKKLANKTNKNTCRRGTGKKTKSQARSVPVTEHHGTSHVNMLRGMVDRLPANHPCFPTLS